MTGATLFTGIATAELAAPEIDWLWCAEIDREASAVIDYRFPNHPNLGDVTAPDFLELASAYGPVDVLVFGSPCQSFSVAGKRLGLDDPRGNLALLALGIAAHLRPRWFVFENVPGLFSSWSDTADENTEESDFAAWLSAVEECRYHVAWHVLDAQHFGVPQRRRRIFAVGHSGDWRYPAAVLFEPEGLPRHHKARREKRPQSPRPANASARLRRFWEQLVSAFDEGKAGSGAEKVRSITAALTHDGVGTCGADDNQAQGGHQVPALAYGGGNCSGDLDVATCQTHHGRRQDFDTETFITHTLRADGFDASEDGTGRGMPLVPLLADPVSAHEGKTYSHEGKNNFRLRNVVPILEPGCRTGPASATERAGMGVGESGDPMYTLEGSKQHAVAFEPRYARNGRGAPEEVTSPLKAESGRTGKGDGAPCVATGFYSNLGTQGGGVEENLMPPLKAGSHENLGAVQQAWAVRRLMPVECERLQGLEDNWTKYGRFFPDGPVKELSDGARYRLVGNGMALPVIRWILTRLQEVDRLS